MTMIKKIGTTVLALLAILFTMAQATTEVKTPGCINPVTNTKVECAFILEQDDGLIAFETEDGNVWFWEQNETLPNDGYYCLFFDTQGTPEREDDEIVKVFKEIA